MAANTYTTYGIADGPSEAGLVRVIMEGEALAQPSEEEVSETIPAERFEHGRASLVAEPYPGTMQVWRGSEAEANLLDESEWTVEGATLTVWELASDPVALVEWETLLSRELTGADFHGGRAALMGEPSSVTLTEDGEPVPYELEGSVLVVEGMGGQDGLVRATYSHAVELTLPAGTSTLPDAPESVTVVGRTLGEDPSEEPAPYVLDGSVLTISEGWDEYAVSYSVQVEEGWSLSEQVREEPAPDSEEGEEGTLEPTSEVVGHVLQWDPEGLSVTLDGEPTTDWTLDGRTVTVGASGASRTLSLTCTMPQSIEVPSSALRASYELPTLPSGEVSVTVGGEALECTVEDRTITVPSLWPEVAQYVVRYSAMVPQGSVEMPCAPVVQGGESVVVTVVNGSPMVTAVMGSGDAQQGQLDDAATIAVEAAEAVDSAVQAAEEAAEIASAVGQHVWSDANGEHVTEATMDEFLATPTGRNILMNAAGILLRDALVNLLQLSRSGMAIYDGQGNAASNVVANILRDLITLGYADESHAEIDYHSLQLIDKEGSAYFHVSDLRDHTGVATITETFYSAERLFRLSLYPRSVVSVQVNGTDVSYQTSGQNVVLDTAPSAGDTTVIVYETESTGAKAYTIGSRDQSKNVGGMSYALGVNVAASGYLSHAEGYHSLASGIDSHAEGMDTVASEFGSHAEGRDSVASGNTSHAQNKGTIAASSSQTALGTYNVEDANDTYAVIVGNGTSDTARSNALTVDWSGNVVANGATLATPLPKASGGTGHTRGLQWQSLGSFTGTNSLTINLSNYSEVMVAAKFSHTFNSQTSHKLVTAVVAKQLLTTTAQELWLGGGKSSGGTANSGALRAICNITTTKVTGVISSADSTDHTSGTTWYVYAR